MCQVHCVFGSFASGLAMFPFNETHLGQFSPFCNSAAPNSLSTRPTSGHSPCFATAQLRTHRACITWKETTSRYDKHNQQYTSKQQHS